VVSVIYLLCNLRIVGAAIERDPERREDRVATAVMAVMFGNGDMDGAGVGIDVRCGTGWC
jgi:hypothetical protein